MRRDFTVNAMALRLPDLTFVDPHGGLVDLDAGLLRTPVAARGVVRRRPAADDARGPVRRAARVRARPRGLRGDARDGGDHRDRLGRAGARRAGQAAAGAAPPGRARAALRERAGGARAARAAGAAARGRRAPPPQGRLRALDDRARAGHRPRGPGRTARRSRCPAPTSCCAWPPCCTTSASRRRGASRAAAGCRFHHHEVVGAKLVAKRLQGAALRQGDDQGRRAPGRAAPALPRLRRGAVDRLRRAPLRHGCRPAPPAAAPPHPRRLHDPQRAQGPPARGHLRRPRDPDRRAARAGGAQGGAPRARRQRDRGRARHPPRAGARAGLQAPARACGWTRARSARTSRASGC